MHRLDRVRGVAIGATTILYSDLDTAERHRCRYNTILLALADGFTLPGADAEWTNASGQTFVSWNWLAANGAGVSNTDGSITSTVSASTTSGFSSVSYYWYWNRVTLLQLVGHGLAVCTSNDNTNKIVDSAESWMVG
jgi:hypothetical protein